MLHLKLPTDPRWADAAQKSLEDILSDHAYCEQKAASSCISLIVQYADHTELVDTLTPIVAEEWSHFERVLAEIRKRELTLAPQRKDEYVNELAKILRKGGSKQEKMLDRLLLCALIEARSCERFKVLSQQLQDPEMSRFYYDFMVSEARHYVAFITLAKTYMPKEIVDVRWQEFLTAEAKIIAELGYRPDRMH